MPCNVGGAERLIRILIGVVLLPVSYLYLSGAGAVVGYVVGAIALLTGLVRFCPINSLIGWSSCEEQPIRR